MEEKVKIEKPLKENYGYVQNEGFDDEPSGWAFEDREAEYYKALELWEKQNDLV
jgi:hypothetical protein